MADALEFLETLQTLNIEAAAIDALEGNEKVMADLNATQLAQGKRATGTTIRPEYHPLTIELKKGRSGLAGITDRVTLFDTGSHYRKLYADVKGQEIEYGSKDEKSEDLQKKYGAIYGLTEESVEELVESHLRGDFIEKIENYLGIATGNQTI